MRLENYTNIPTEKIREMIRFVKPKYSGVSKLNNITVQLIVTMVIVVSFVELQYTECKNNEFSR